jgi:ferrochelatase
MKKVAVLLFNLGGPKGPEDVRPFLYNLFKDKYIIGLPAGIRHAVAATIAGRRAPSARENYAKMGGGSPIVRETEAQAQALQASLNGSGFEARVFIGMRYWHPFIEQAAAGIADWRPDEVVLLPLYPQFSSTTTLTGFEVFQRAYKGQGRVTRVCCYAANDDFIAAHVKLIADKLMTLPPGYRLLFSAHGLPERIVARGDPYQMQVEACVARIVAGLGDVDHTICYQSRVGPLKWIGPSTEEAIRETGAAGKNALVIPIAFVSEHIETLVELDMDYAEVAKAAGMAGYVRVPALGIASDFIAALRGEVLKAVGRSEAVIGDNECRACDLYCPRKRA